jgi:hypothetical protein
MFFLGKILDSKPILHSEDIEDGKSGTEGIMSFHSFRVPRLASGAIIIIRVNVTNTTVIDPYYVSAAYDQGSNQYPNFLPSHIQARIFPNILAGRIDPVQQLAITASTLAAILFSVASIAKSIRKSKKTIKTDHLIWVIPAVVLTSIFLLFVFEELPRTLLLASSVLIRPIDISTGVSFFAKPFGSDYNQGQLIAGAFVFCGISWFARYMIGYPIVAAIMAKLYAGSIDDVEFLKRRAFRYISFVLVGTPVYSFIVLFFSKAIEGFYPSSLFLTFLLVDIVRLLSIVLVIPKLRKKMITIAILYFSLIGISVVISTAQSVLLVLIIKEFHIFNNNDPLSSFIFVFSLVTLIVYGFIACYIARQKRSTTDKIARKTQKALYYGAMALTIILWSVWIVCIFIYATMVQHQILRTDIPIINIGIISILSGFAFWLIASFLTKFSNDKKSQEGNLNKCPSSGRKIT